jgi:hypothetical protein
MRTLAAWRVRIGDAAGQPEDIISAAPGNRLVVVEADVRSPGARLAARLRVTVPVSPGRTTALRIIVPALPQR